MDHGPQDAVEQAADALLRELDEASATARRLDRIPDGSVLPEGLEGLRRQVHEQREQGRELARAVEHAHRRASVLVSAARALVDDVRCAHIELHEWPRHRTGATSDEHVALTRAVRFVEGHAAEPIGVADIADAARVGVRHLQVLFRRDYDVAPTGYLRRVRLDGAHEDLRAADPTRGTTVEAIARRWQFGHLGRFATSYRERFGCVPSETLRRVVEAPRAVGFTEAELVGRPRARAE